MPLLNLTLRHGRTFEDARRGLASAVDRISAQFGALLRRVEWSPGRERVKLEGVGFWIEIWVDAEVLHATGDVPVLGALLGGQITSGVKQILQQTFQKQLP